MEYSHSEGKCETITTHECGTTVVIRDSGTSRHTVDMLSSDHRNLQIVLSWPEIRCLFKALSLTREIKEFIAAEAERAAK